MLESSATLSDVVGRGVIVAIRFVLTGGLSILYWIGVSFMLLQPIEIRLCVAFFVFWQSSGCVCVCVSV